MDKVIYLLIYFTKMTYNIFIMAIAIYVNNNALASMIYFYLFIFVLRTLLALSLSSSEDFKSVVLVVWVFLIESY